MKLNYKRLGEYIQPVEGRNTDLRDIPLMGLSINKVFIPSIANTIGTNMATYRIIKRNQFGYGPVTSRNGEKITIALFDDYDEAMISQAYTPFEVTDTEKLLPEYLMMWFRRPEFDRYARFKSHGSAREIFSWDEMQEVMLPIPHPNKQREIVKEYNILQNRIKLNEQLIQKLEETAQAIYREWFVEFEFPFDFAQGKPDENGKPYKSNGGEMVWNEELEKEIPLGWENITVKDFCVDMKSGGTPSRINYEYWNINDVPWLKTGEIKNNIILSTEEFISNEGLKNSSAKLLPKDTVLMSMYGVNAGDIGILKIEASTNQACCGMICENQNHSAYLYYHLLHNQDFIASQSIGGAQENLSKDYVEKIPILKPKKDLLEKKAFKSIIDNKELKTLENQKLTELKDLLLSKLATVEN